MAITSFGDISPRTAAYAEKELLKRGIPYLVLEKFGQAKSLPEHSSKVVKFRRYNALSSTPAALTEGVTPASQILSATDVTATLAQYGGRTTMTDVVMDTHEDPVLAEAINLLGEQAAQVIEKMRFGIVKAGTNVIFTTGAARDAVVDKITIAMQRKATRALKRQNARPITKIVRSTPAFDTENVAPSYIGLIHPDMEGDIRGLAGFTPAEQYGSISPYENELGKVEDVRYITSTIFEPWADAGGLKGTMISTSGTNADVYPVLYLGQDAYGIIALKGAFAVTPTVVNPKPSDSDPLGQRGHAGWKAMQTACILNDLFMVRLEAACTA